MDNEKTKPIPPRETLFLFWNSVRRIVSDLDVEDSKFTEDHENRVRRHYNQLLSNINVPDVVTQMFQSGKLTAKEYEHIRQFYSTPIRASEELLNIVILNSRDVYECFLELLKKTKQHHVYQMLTCDEESECIGEQSVSEHSRLIRQNYDWLTKKLDLDSGLLQTLYAKEVLSQREYGQILFERDQFLRNEMLMTIISRKSIEDFKKFIVVLNDTLQGHIAKRLTETPLGDANQNVTTTVIKTVPTVCSDTFEKRIPPKPPPKPKIQPPTSSHSKPLVIKPKPSVKPKFHPSKPNRIENRQSVTNLEIMRKRSVQYLQEKFRGLPNELQTEVSTKVVQLHQRKPTDNIWKITLTKILEESRNIQRQNLMQAKANDENCERLKQEIIHREGECKIIKEDNQREKTKSQKQLRELQETVYELEYRRTLAENENRNMLEKLKKNEVEVEGLKTLNRHKEQEANEKISIIKKLEVQVTYSKIKLNETAAQLRETTDKLTESDRTAKETTRKLEETQERLKETETKLTEFEAKLIETEKRTANLRSEDVVETLFDLTQKFEEERKVWDKEREQFIKQDQDLQQELSGSRDKCLDVEQKLKLERMEIDHLKEQIQEFRTMIDELQEKCTSNPVLVHTIRTKSGKKKNLNIFRFAMRRKSSAEREDISVVGMTILDNELFVVSFYCSKVEVYDSMKLSFSRRWNLKESIFHPIDIASCKGNKCLYIYCGKEDRTTEIFRFDPNGKLIMKWSTGDELGRGLSVTDESNVVVIFTEKNRLDEYSPDGQLIREINLSSDAGIREPMHAIKLTNGHFVVCHGEDEDHLHRVCLVDADGKLKKSFGGKWGSSFGQMENPAYLAVDGNGFVMVVDQGNSRVLLLDSDLKFKRVILSKKNGLHDPSNILFDEANSRLFVADNLWHPDGRILIFSFEINK